MMISKKAPASPALGRHGRQTHSHLRRRLFLLASAAPPPELAPSTQPEGLARRVAAGLPPSPLFCRVQADVRRSFSFSCWAWDSGRRRRMGSTRADPVGVRPQQQPGAWLVVHAASSRVAALAALGHWIRPVSGSRKPDLAVLVGSTRGGDGAAAVPGGLGQCAQRPSAVAHGARWPDPTVEVVCARWSGPTAVPGGLSAAVQRLGGVAVVAPRGQPERPSDLGCSSFPLPPSGSGGGGFVASAAASGRWRC
jgi:hypothetical protein